jgi:hypothetical protein
MPAPSSTGGSPDGRLRTAPDRSGLLGAKPVLGHKSERRVERHLAADADLVG